MPNSPSAARPPAAPGRRGGRTAAGGSGEGAIAGAVDAATDWSARRTAAMMRQAVFVLGVAVALLALAQSPTSGGAGGAAVLTLDGAIGPGTSRQVSLGLQQAQRDKAAVVVLRMDTPGGLDTSMREIVRAILASPLPVLGYVGPSGARAASAGTFILYASHVAAMAPGTNLGAATPVSLGGGSAAPTAEAASQADQGAAKNKALNDAIAYIRGLAEMRGRNVEWAELAVRDAASLPAQDALAQGVVDLVAADVPALLQQAHGREVQTIQGKLRLQTAGIDVRHIHADWRTRALSVLANPNLALLLVMIGVYGLLFEFMAPGALVPGVVGAIALLLGLYALSALPLNLAGAALLFLGMALLVAEAFAPSFGVLGLGGMLAFVLGAAMLFDDHNAEALQLSLPLVAGIGLAGLTASILVLRLALRTRRLRSHSGSGALAGQRAEVLDWALDLPEGHVLLAGERWRAGGEAGLRPGQQVWVVDVQGLHVRVTTRPPAPNGQQTASTTN